MCEKCKMEMKNTEKNTHKNDETVSREITMMVSVAHKMTSDFNQMVEYRIKNACVRTFTFFHTRTHTRAHTDREMFEKPKKNIQKSKRDFIYRNNRQKIGLLVLTSYSSTDTIWHI